MAGRFFIFQFSCWVPHEADGCCMARSLMGVCLLRLGQLTFLLAAWLACLLFVKSDKTLMNGHVLARVPTQPTYPCPRHCSGMWEDVLPGSANLCRIRSG